MVDSAATVCLRSLARLRQAIEADGGQFPETVHLSWALEEAVDRELHVENTLPITGRCGRRWSILQWRRRAKYMAKKLREANADLQSASDKAKHRLKNH